VEQEAQGPKDKKKRCYTTLQAEKKNIKKRHRRGLKNAYRRGVKDKAATEERLLLEKIKNGDYMYFGSRIDQLKFLQDFLQFDGSHLSPQDLAIKFSTTNILWNEHKSNNKRQKTFKAFHDIAYFE